jgi:pimeloyl-ACP methyl ester carboxylesterase
MGVVLVFGPAGSAREASAFAPRGTYERAGRLARLPDGRKLNFVCTGTGSPTVLLEAGFSAWSFAWDKVQARLAPITRACAYDRAGYGFSDPGPLPRDGESIARDLDRGLRAAHINGPFVLVGHSAGGLYQRLFAARRRRDVVGLVFVDSSVEHQPQRIAALFGEKPVGFGGTRRRPAHCLEVTEGPASAATEADRGVCEALMKPGAPGLGLRADPWRSQLSELDTLFEQTSDEVDRTRGLLKDVPAIVLTAAAADGPAGAAADPGAAAWQGLHRELAAQFRHGQQRLVKSGHLMMNERPEVVAATTIELVEQARKTR